MIVKQLAIGSMDNFCYIVGCETTRKALVIDPGPDVAHILSVADEEGLSIEMIVNTHTHGDHTAGNDRLKAATGAQVVLHAREADGYPRADIRLSDESPLMSFKPPVTRRAASACMPTATCLPATRFLWETAAAPIFPEATAPPWVPPFAA